MTEGAFDDFVRVRWGDLEPAARLVVLDPAAAREVTTSALVRLRSEWSASGDDVPARPVETARRHVLTEAVSRAHRSTADLHVDRDPAVAAGGETADPVVDALVAHLRALDPLARALIAGRLLWDLRPEDVARLLHRPAPDLRDRDRALRDGLAATHTTARGDDGPAPWALDRDLADAVDIVLRDLSDPPDPAALVGDRVRRVRRRSLVLGGMAAAAVVGAGAAVALRDPPAGVTARPLPGPSDRAWLSTSQWPVRGPLAGDPSLRALVAGRMSPVERILWAGDLGTRRLAVVWTPPTDGFVGESQLRLFTGARGTDPASLSEVEAVFMAVPSTDSVAVVVPDGPEQRTPRSTLLLLARPEVTTASYSTHVRPTAAGDRRRTWTEVALEAGIGTVTLDTAAPPALRVRVDGFDGAAAGVGTAFGLFNELAGGEREPADVFEEFIADMTAIPVSSLVTTLTARDALDGGLFDEPGAPRGPNGARVVAMRTRTPEGAVLRSSAYVDERGSAFPLELALVVPAETPDVPWLTETPPPRPGFLSWLVIHPGAASVQVTGAGGAAGAASPVVGTRRGHATVVIAASNPGLAGEVRVVLRDTRGRRTYDAVPPVGRSLFDG